MCASPNGRYAEAGVSTSDRSRLSVSARTLLNNSHLRWRGGRVGLLLAVGSRGHCNASARSRGAISVIASEGMPVQTACRVLGVSESGFYAWTGRSPLGRSIRHAWLTDKIRQVHSASRGTYGAPRVHAELTMGYGITVGHNAVAMLMQRAGLTGLPGSRRVVGWSIRHIAHIQSGHCRVRDGHRQPATKRDGDPLRPGHPTQVHSPGPSIRTGPIHEIRRRLFRQRRRRSVLGPDASRTSQPSTVADPYRTGQRHLRIPRDLPQPPETPLQPGNANTDRIRENPLRQPNRSTPESSELTPRNPGNITASMKPRAIHRCLSADLSCQIRRVEGGRYPRCVMSSVDQ